MGRWSHALCFSFTPEGDPDRLNKQSLMPGATPVAHIYADNWGIYLFT